MEQISLNLARKWRSGNFKTIIGQDLVVRMLQNSLFKNQFFPVYLFSGQRGCGKTSTARVFAAALNCYQLSEFQKNAHVVIPCLQCVSCVALSKGQHPDFIEIDGASYTGVDNIRNIIDTSAFLPILGKKKVYLIDEVHMLSKAAFNAFLKILEEPPKFVVFILATTEIQKLPETIRSRCFQLFFNAIDSAVIVNHLQHVCTQEKIGYDIAGLEMIAFSTQGSMRDALNLLEQTRFASAIVDKSAVLGVLGYPDDQIIFNVLFVIIDKKHQELAQLLNSWNAAHISIEYVIKRMIEMTYDLLMVHYQSALKYKTLTKAMIEQSASVSLQSLIVCFDELCKLDGIIHKTSRKQLLFESLMLRIALRDEIALQGGASVTHATLQEQKKKSGQFKQF